MRTIKHECSREAHVENGASCQQLYSTQESCDWEEDPIVPIKPLDDLSLGRHLNQDLVRDPVGELPS